MNWPLPVAVVDARWSRNKWRGPVLGVFQGRGGGLFMFGLPCVYERDPPSTTGLRRGRESDKRGQEQGKRNKHRPPQTVTDSFGVTCAKERAMGDSHTTRFHRL